MCVATPFKPFVLCHRASKSFLGIIQTTWRRSDTCGEDLEMFMPSYLGLEALEKNARDGVLWEDLDEIVQGFTCFGDHPYCEVTPYHGLGQFLFDTLTGESQWLDYEQQHFVGVELTKTLNGMLKLGAYDQDIFCETAELRTVGDVCCGQHMLRPPQGLLPEDRMVSLERNERYPSICLGRCKRPVLDKKGNYVLDENKEVVQFERVLKIRGHRLACWLKNGNPRGGTNRKQEVVNHACVGKPQCVRLDCLTWDSQRANVESARAQKKRRRSRWVRVTLCLNGVHDIVCCAGFLKL